MNLRNERSQQTRRRLLDAALQLSAQRGFAALSLREVTRAAELSPNSFYKHFRNMDELGLQLVDEVGLTLRRLMRESRRSREDQDSRTLVRASIDTFLHYVSGNPNHFRLLLGERQGSSAAFRKALHAEMDRFIGELTEDLGQGFAQSPLPMVDPGLVAEAIVAVVFTVGAEALDLPVHRTQQLAERLVQVVHVILRGAYLRPRQPLESNATRRSHPHATEIGYIQ